MTSRSQAPRSPEPGIDLSIVAGMALAKAVQLLEAIRVAQQSKTALSFSLDVKKCFEALHPFTVTLEKLLGFNAGTPRSDNDLLKAVALLNGAFEAHSGFTKTNEFIIFIRSEARRQVLLISGLKLNYVEKNLLSRHLMSSYALPEKNTVRVIRFQETKRERKQGLRT